MALLPVLANGNDPNPSPELLLCHEVRALEWFFRRANIHARVWECGDRVVLRVRGLLGAESNGDRNALRADVLRRMHIADPVRSNAGKVDVYFDDEIAALEESN